MKALVPILVILAGAGVLIFGFGFHNHIVHFDESVEIEAPPFEPDPFAPIPEPPPASIFVTEEKQTAEPEYRLVLEVTRGGVERLASGKLKRTYVLGSRPPDLCPT